MSNVADTLRDACILVVLVVLSSYKMACNSNSDFNYSGCGNWYFFGGMYALGFSINNLTLFGLILSIGIVVDDSIVVIENVERIMEQQKCSAKQASIKSMEEVTVLWLPLFWFFVVHLFLLLS